jgi:histidine phosphotransfer protein HptB
MSFQTEALDKMFQMIGSDPVVMVELLESFLDETPLLLQRLRTAMKAGDAAELAMAAHTLKSTARDFGAARLTDYCQDLESQCRQGVPFDVEARVEAIALELDLSHTGIVECRGRYVSGAAVGAEQT